MHCDHLIQARVGADIDLKSALDVNSEVYEFLRTVSAKYGIGFWKPGSGIIHQVVLEQYAFPGGMMIGTDSHTPNAGGLGMVAIGVGGADAVDVMAGWPFNTRVPKLIGVHLRGSLSGWAAAEGRHPQGRRHPHGEGRHRRDRRVLRPGRGVDLGDRQGHDLQHGRRDRRHVLAVPLRRTAPRAYLKATGREALADLADAHAEHLRIDPEVDRRPRAVLRPGDRHRPRRARAAPRRPAHARPRPPDLRGRPRRRARRATRSTSATRSSARARTRRTRTSGAPRTSRARRSAAGLQVKTPLLITPGSEQVRATIERDGLLADLEAIGATVLANACGPCIGQWQRDDIETGERNTIVSSFNRNFPARNDGNAATLSFIGSPETVTAMALTGRLDVDFVHEPRHRAPTAPRCSSSRRRPTSSRRKGFDPGESGFVAAGRRPVDGRRWSWRPTPSGSSCSSRSPRGTAATSPGCRC